jgi:hypothetical protein
VPSPTAYVELNPDGVSLCDAIGSKNFFALLTACTQFFLNSLRGAGLTVY